MSTRYHRKLSKVGKFTTKAALSTFMTGFEIGINQSRCSRHLIQTEALIESSEDLFQKGNIKVLIHE